jgi:hypothetical protein
LLSSLRLDWLDDSTRAPNLGTTELRKLSQGINFFGFQDLDQSPGVEKCGFNGRNPKALIG